MKRAQKLFLASEAWLVIDRLFEIMPQRPRDLTVAFIPTAANVAKDKWFIDEDFNALVNSGFNVVSVDLAGITKERLWAKLKDVDVLFVAGGNAFYLAQEAHKSGFYGMAKSLIKRGVVYVGSSAGSVFAGPTIEPVKTLDDPQEAPDLKSHKGLELVNFVILPHYIYEASERKEEYDGIVREYAASGLRLVPLTDQEAIVVKGDKYRIVVSLYK